MAGRGTVTDVVGRLVVKGGNARAVRAVRTARAFPSRASCASDYLSGLSSRACAGGPDLQCRFVFFGKGHVHIRGIRVDNRHQQ